MHAVSDIGPLCLVTGGAGFVGRALTRHLLDAGYQVRVFDRAAHPELDARAELVRGDLCDAEALRAAVQGATSVFHTAAMIHLSGLAKPASRQRVFDVNVKGTENVLDACTRASVKALVYTSTNNVVFDPLRDVLSGDEREPYATGCVDLYSQTKIEAERRVLAAGKAGALRTCALRPGGIWGPYPGGVMLDKVLEQIARGTFVARIGGRSLADNTHVDNLCDAQLLAARALIAQPSVVSGEAYFITDGEPMDPFDWFAPLLAELGYRPPRWSLPAPLMYRLAHALEWAHRAGGPEPLITRIEVLKISRRHTYRIDKARTQLGYVPRIKSREGLAACVPYARAYLARRRGELAG